MNKIFADSRIVLTLDAGGTNFAFSAMQGGKEIVEGVTLPACGQDLEMSLANLKTGFTTVRNAVEGEPAAISFAFPGPADYPAGIVDNYNNLPGYGGGVPLGPWLKEQFGIPVYLNNDADLFVLGEAINGLLPEVNQWLANTGSPKRFKNIFGITLGTGFGAGLVRNGELYEGDNSCGLEIFLMRNGVHTEAFAEEGVSIRGVRHAYGRHSGEAISDTLTPKDIEDIATGKRAGNQQAAVAAYAEFGRIIGEALANAVTLLDALIVIGGGLSKGRGLFMESVLQVMNGRIARYNGDQVARIVQRVYDLDNAEQRAQFLQSEVRHLTIPGTDRTVPYDPVKRIGLGRSRLGTNHAVSLGAYAYAIHAIDS